MKPEIGEKEEYRFYKKCYIHGIRIINGNVERFIPMFHRLYKGI